VTKSVVSLLNYYGWNKFSIIYEEAWEKVADSLSEQANTWNKTVNHKLLMMDRDTCCFNGRKCCSSGSTSWFDVSFLWFSLFLSFRSHFELSLSFWSFRSLLLILRE
jgi:hypothetical protein